MIKLVKKRDGRLVPFEKQKIVNAISKAGNVKQEVKNRIANEIAHLEQEQVGIEEIQDLVEKKLMASSYKNVAKEYVRYRFKRELIREKEATNNSVIDILNMKNQDINEENSNKNPVVLSTQRDYMAGEVSKDLSMRLLLPEDIVEAHQKGIIHFHDADYFSQKMFNCFSGGTKFITDSGVKRFKDFKDGSIVYVKDMNGVTRKATVHTYGFQKMNKVVLKNFKGTHEVVCTPNHRWVLYDGTVTTNLQVGDRLKGVAEATEPVIETFEDAKAFALGFVLGDGYDNGNATRVRLCGNKCKYASIFKTAGFTEHSCEGYTDMFMYYGLPLKQNFINGFGWRYLTVRQKELLFYGYYCADGAKDSNSLSTSDERLCDFIEETAGIAGYYISSKKEVVRDTAYKVGAKLITYHFIRKTPINQTWKVESIIPYRHTYKGEDGVLAWCVEEPVTHTFLLDKGIVTGNCSLINLEDMLQNGTVINGTMIEKPHSFATACNIATQIMAQIASNQYGGQSITLSHLAPFVDVSRQKIKADVYDELSIYDKMFDGEGIGMAVALSIDKIVEKRLKAEIARGVQTMQYQINTLMTSNGQTPFVTLFMYLNEVKDPQTKADLAMIIEEVVKQRYKGTKNEKGVYITPAFPKLIYVLEEDNIREGSKYWYLTKLCAKCTAKRLVPDYVSEKKMLELKVDKNGKGHCYAPMGCRSFLTPYVDEDGKPKYWGRFNCGVVTINLVDVALSSKGDFDKFWEIFEERLELCHRALQCRHQHLRGTISDVSPIHWQYGAIARLKKGETIDKLLYNGYCTISLGYAGLYECVKAMTGKSHTDAEAKPFAIAVMQKLNDKCAEWKADEHIDYSVYGTPIESTTYKFAKSLRDRFGVIEGITDHNYITNSYHVNVREAIDAFTKLKFESEFQALSPGGAISYIEAVNLNNNVEAVLAVMQFIYDNIMYAEINTKSDYCQECGFDGEIQIVTDEKTGQLVWECPNCGNRNQKTMNVCRRTCGYLGSQFWNQGRTEEIRDRYVHLGNDM